MKALREAINSAIDTVEPRKARLEVTDELDQKIKRMSQLFLKSQDAKNGLLDSFADWFEAQGKTLVGLKDDEYSLDDMDTLMGIVGTEIDKVLK